MMGLDAAVRSQPSFEPTQPEHAPHPASKDPYLPSVHTGLVIQALHQHADVFNKDSGLDIGVGSGVLLAVLGSLGVRRLTGSDIDPEAVRSTQSLLVSLGFNHGLRLITGSMWDELDASRFDVITANLPAFPASEACDPDHAPHWSCGGPDGRKLMDVFLAGLPAHLAPEGVAFLAHNVFLGRARTDAMLRDGGLSSRTVMRTSIPLDPRKAAMMNPQIRYGNHVTGLRRFGRYEFMDVEVLEIRRSHADGTTGSH